MEEEKTKSEKIFDFIILIWCLLCSIVLIILLIAPFKAEQIRNSVLYNIDITNIQTKHTEYFYDYDFEVVQNTQILFPENKKELINTIRTIENMGITKIKFYCNPSYKECFNDYLELYTKDKNSNNMFTMYIFNHPFNDYYNFTSSWNDRLGYIILEIEKKYTDEQIEKINEKVDEIFKKLYDSQDSIETTLLKFNNYLIDSIDYDSERAEELRKVSEIRDIKNSDTAYGALFDGKAICSGYTDVMFLLIKKLGLKQMRVVGYQHIWNAVEINNKWYHIDVTWNDDNINNSYFLIDTKTLLEYDTEYHNFDFNIWKELEIKKESE